MREWRILLVGLLALAGASIAPVVAHAQATFDAQSSTIDTLTSAANTTTLAHTTGAGANRILLVSVSMNIRNATGTTVSGVTYGGTPLTLLDAISDSDPETRTELWYLLAPASGTANVVMTAGGITPGQNVEAVVGATTFSNADQSAPPTSANFGQNSPISTTLTGTGATDLVLDFIGVRESVTSTANGAQTAGYAQTTGTSGDDIDGRSSGRLAATPNTTMSWTISANRRWTHIVTAIRRASADVEVTQYAVPDPVAPGGTLTYTFNVVNNGPSTATGVTLTDTIPVSTTFVSSSTTQGSCSGTSTVTCNVGTLATGASATITIVVTAPLTGGLIAANTGTVTTTTFDPVTPNTATATSYSLVQSTVCGTQPGKDGAGGTLAGIVNSYWPGTANAAVGATSITVGARRGAAVSITAGDLVLIMQMQDAAIDSNNDDRYGNGLGTTGGTSGIGAGYTNANNAGRYEYAIATNTIGAAGGALTFTAVGGGNGLMFAYTNAAATVTMGQRRFQVIRVPQYTTATLGGTLSAATWNGTTGGVLAIDVAGDLALGSTTVNVNGLGFRGGAGLQRAGGGAATAVDYRNVVGTNVHGVKGEGIAGTPEWVLDAGANLDVGPQGYPNGDFARGAPGNAGGGGTDTDPATNAENSGGGGGANWGRGGTGGNAWASNLARGGFGGAPFYDSPGRVVLGGGGGAGARNNSSGIASAGAAGGGIVLIRAGRLTGTGTITANGSAAFNTTANDGGGGGGAGGSIVVLTRGGGFGGLTVQANGGRGGDAWSTQAPGGYPGERHGPGGGGGGGYVALNGTPAATSVTGGASGITTTANDTFGAQAGAPGTVVLTASFDQITGVRSGCVDISVATSDAPDPVIAGNQLTFTQSVTNNSTNVPAYTVVLTQTTPPGTTFVSMTPPAGWSCTTPLVGGTGTVTCTKTDPLAPSTGSGNFVFVVATDPGLTDGSTITQPVSTSTSSPEANTANNSASTTTTVIRRVDVAVTKTASDPGVDGSFAQGENVSYSVNVTNNGASRATNVVMTDTLPAGLSFVSVVPGGPTCTQSLGTVTCTWATLNPSASQAVTITATITTSGALIENTASVTRTETDTNAANNSDTEPISVVYPTFVKIVDFSATQEEDGKVYLRWTTSFEADNLGFNVYRVGPNGEKEKINKQLIAGSALFSSRRELANGRSYHWKDRTQSGVGQYLLEDVDIDGTRATYGPIAPVRNAGPSRWQSAENAASLADVAPTASPSGDNGLGAPPAAGSKPELAQQWKLAAQEAARITVSREGWYRLTHAQLISAGFDPGSKGKLSLYSSGIEQPLFVHDGGDGSFDSADFVTFYGVGDDTPSTGERAYWLTRESPKGSLTRPEPSRGGGNAQNATHYTVRSSDREIYFAALATNGERENFFAAIVTSSPVSEELAVLDLDANDGGATLNIVLQGAIAGTHRVRVALNDTPIGTITFRDLERTSRQFTVKAHELRGGTNTVTLTALGGDEDVSVLESLELTYPRKLTATRGALKVVSRASGAVTVTGFSSANVIAFDVTDALRPILLETAVRSEGAAFRATASASRRDRTLVFFESSRTDDVTRVAATKPTTWNDKKNAADVLIIGHRSLLPSAKPLVARHQAQGLVTQLVDVEAAYDEFGYGAHGPAPIRELLRRSRSWKTAPRYVILLGDASFDPRNYLGFGDVDLVPTKLVATQILKAPSDDWFGDLTESGLSQIAIGRLPARTAADAETMVRKIVERAPTGSWSTTVRAVAGGSDPSFDFAVAAQSLNALVPATYDRKVTAASEAFDALLTSYVGHGSVELWSGALDGAGAAALRNGSHLPVVASMTCLTGYFHDVFTTSLAESLLLNPQGGAVAVWASSTLSDPAPQVEAARAFYRQLFAGARLGDAAIQAKGATASTDVRRSWILFGDPTMKLIP